MMISDIVAYFFWPPCIFVEKVYCSSV